jgi:hypothetical protein
MRTAAMAFLAAFTLAGTACDGPRGDDGAGIGAAEPSMTAPAAAPTVGSGEQADEARSLTRGEPGNAAGGAPPAPSGETQFTTAVPTTGMVIRTGNASLEVDSLEPAIAAIRRLVGRVGGYVGNTSLQAGDESVRSAMLELRIPADRFDEVVAGLAPVGEVEYVNVNAEDVGEQYVDLSARAENARRLETRLTELLAERTGKLGDVLAVERELARVREEIERLDGRMRYLRTRAEMSSLSVSVHEPGPLVGRPGDHPIADALRQAWRNAVAFAAWTIAAMGVLVPVAVLVAIGLFLWRRFAPRRPAAATE